MKTPKLSVIDWKCPNRNCLGKLEDLTFYEPRVLHQNIVNGRIITVDSSLCEGDSEGFFECDLCGCRHHPDDRVHCPDNTIVSLLDLWYERASENSSRFTHEGLRKKWKAFFTNAT